MTARITASQTGTGGQPLPSSPSWSSWGTSAPRPLGFGARRPPGSWPLPLESWSPPPRLMRARLLCLCGERPPHSGGRAGAGETMEEAVSGSPRRDPEDRARPAGPGAECSRGTLELRPRDCLQVGPSTNPGGDCQWRPVLVSWVLNQKSAQMLSTNSVSDAPRGQPWRPRVWAGRGRKLGREEGARGNMEPGEGASGI